MNAQEIIRNGGRCAAFFIQYTGPEIERMFATDTVNWTPGRTDGGPARLSKWEQSFVET